MAELKFFKDMNIDEMIRGYVELWINRLTLLHFLLFFIRRE